MNTPFYLSLPILRHLALATAMGTLSGSLVLAAEVPAKPEAAKLAVAPPESLRLISLVLLLSEHRTIDAAAVAHAVSKAVAADIPEDAVTVKLPSYIVKTANGRFAVNSVDEPYFADSNNLAAELKLPALADAVRNHHAWLSVDWLEKDDKADLRKIYQQIGHTIAQLVRKDTLAIYCPDTDQFHLNDSTLVGHLMSEDPLHELVPASLGVAADGKIIIGDDDPKLVAAQAEAKKHWPEFLAAFKARTKDQYFGVKGRIQEGDQSEFLWLQVTDIDDTIVHGILDNDPADLKKIARGIDLHIPIVDVDDWLYSTGKGKADVKGGYTLRVFDELVQAQPKN